jgi:hypothetical protein
MSRLQLGFILVIIALVAVTGCTSTAPVSIENTTAVVTAAPTVAPTTQPTVQPTAQPTVVPTIEAVDPIVGHWIHYGSANKPGVDYRFTKTGAVVIGAGDFKEVSGKARVTSNLAQVTGTWINLGDGNYLIEVVPSGFFLTNPVAGEIQVVGNHLESQALRDAVTYGKEHFLVEQKFPVKVNY